MTWMHATLGTGEQIGCRWQRRAPHTYVFADLGNLAVTLDGKQAEQLRDALTDVLAAIEADGGNDR